MTSLEGRLLFAIPKSKFLFRFPLSLLKITWSLFCFHKLHLQQTYIELVSKLCRHVLVCLPTYTFTEGRLQQSTLDLLAGCDIQFRRETRLDIALVKNLPIALIFLPAADIPTFVGEGRVDLGITGRDQVAEHDAHLPAGEVSNVVELLDLGFGRCKLQVQVPQNGGLTDPKQLIGKNVVTSFTGLTNSFFSQLEGGQLNTKIKYVGGSVEAACALGVADGIVDLVGMIAIPLSAIFSTSH